MLNFSTYTDLYKTGWTCYTTYLSTHLVYVGTLQKLGCQLDTFWGVIGLCENDTQILCQTMTLLRSVKDDTPIGVFITP